MLHKKIAKKVSKFAKTQARGTKIVGKAVAKTAKTLSFGVFKSRGGKLLAPGIKITNVRPTKKFKKIDKMKPKKFKSPTRKPSTRPTSNRNPFKHPAFQKGPRV